jgi:hypothetical protein
MHESPAFRPGLPGAQNRRRHRILPLRCPRWAAHQPELQPSPRACTSAARGHARSMSPATTRSMAAAPTHANQPTPHPNRSIHAATRAPVLAVGRGLRHDAGSPLGAFEWLRPTYSCLHAIAEAPAWCDDLLMSDPASVIEILRGGGRPRIGCRSAHRGVASRGADRRAPKRDELARCRAESRRCRGWLHGREALSRSANTIELHKILVSDNRVAIRGTWRGIFDQGIETLPTGTNWSRTSLACSRSTMPDPRTRDIRLLRALVAS